MSSAQLKKFALVKPAEIEWRNGLPFSLEFEDVYFSVHGAVEESTHVFIEGSQLTNDWNAYPDKSFTLAELGFGSGLNFLNTVFHWLEHRANEKNNSQHLNYIAIEKRPFNKNDLVMAHKLWPKFSNISEIFTRNYPSQTYGRHQLFFKEWNVTLTLIWMPLENALKDLIQESSAQENKTKIDHWYLDGFAPKKNKSMWSETNAFQIAQLSEIGTRITSYSVAGSVKRPLIVAGFKIRKRQGFAKKREMLTAVLLEEAPHKTDSLQKTKPKFINIKYESPWFNISKVKNQKTNKVAIVGAGIAGCATAYCLSIKGFTCDIYETKEEIASAASGAAAGIFHPQLTTDMNLASQFSWLAYLNLLRFLSSLTTQERSRLIINQGVHRFLDDHNSKQKLINLSRKLHLSHWIKEVDKTSDSHHLKNEREIYLPDSAVLDIPALCQLYINRIDNNSINVYTGSKVESLVEADDDWQITSSQGQNVYQHVVFCGGARSHLIDDFHITATNTTRGQTCQFKSETLYEAINHTISEQIYLVPQQTDSTQQLQLGATFENEKNRIFEDPQLNITSQKEILNRCSKLLKELSLACLTEKQISKIPLRGTVGYRLHSNDRLPLVGAVVDQLKIAETFSDLGQKRLLRRTISNYNQKGLWMNTAYGSHGLLHSLLASQHLTCLMSNEISPLEQKISNRLHPARFLIKQLNHPFIK